jgi:hypothetical protein
MADTIDRAQCCCGCFVNIRDVLAQTVREGENLPLRAVILVADTIHDDQDSLAEAAISANQLRRAGTQVFLVQLSDDLNTAHRLKYLAKVSGGTYFQFDPRTQEQQFAEMFEVVSVYTTGGEAAVKVKGGQAATLLLKHLKQTPMSTIETRERAPAMVREQLKTNT